ncbi:ergothioneine biosynthesis glutamate--cysteine ligase EgtA [Actinoplanes sp. NBRC 101535]|uniref:ergothioneine biosynthesis glutamate--cysteine ligase EgtA n=1 Tax=Actinoplanes sp. NBRC 101535 TaxID=3032196 RepID=UPI0024A42C99|nr:ergothioneine biosynthesis glutamate--cysteine ligase EgtA [Actinoplanes sp. NBRC 101535]GLY07550.1 glutamate--cysteine ligase EgtA [Actinoplanes sp. NBRC 101535]
MGSTDRVLRRSADAIEHISGICFKTGPPRRIGAELEWTTHRAGEPSAYLRPADLAAALGEHAPATLGNTAPVPLPAGGAVTLEPGGQVEISSTPADSLAALHTAITTDHAVLAGLLARSGIVLGDHGIDPERRPRRILDTPRYAAMHRAFDEAGRTMMGSTAGLQVCFDAGEPGSVAARWHLLHEAGPALLALFATSRRHAGRDTGWASARMAAWFGIDQRRTAPVPATGDPAGDWARYAVEAPLLCVRTDDTWDAPPGTTLADWIETGAVPGRTGRPPTLDDLDYHLGTLFPPVRPRGYLEVRYLDAQPGDEWIAPAAVLTALLAADPVTDRARELAAPAAGRWQAAARHGLADPDVHRSAADLADLACRNLDRTGLAAPVRDLVAGIVSRRLGQDLHQRERIRGGIR